MVILFLAGCLIFANGKTDGDPSTGFDFSPEIALLAIALELVGYLYHPTLNNQSGTFRNPLPSPPLVIKTY